MVIEGLIWAQKPLFAITDRLWSAAVGVTRIGFECIVSQANPVKGQIWTKKQCLPLLTTCNQQ